MFNLFTQYFILINFIFLAIFSLTFSDLYLLWFMMEMNNFLFICYMCLIIKNKKMIFFYYVIQILASLILIFFISINNIYFKSIWFSSIFMFFSLLLKLGIPPFHFWMPMFSIHCPWIIIFFFLTIQKLIPFYMFSFLLINFTLLMFIIFMCSFIPPFMSMNSLNFKKILSYSSINQSGWMILLIFLKSSIWLIYFFFYMFSFLLLILLIKKFNIKFNMFNKKFFNLSFLNFILMFSILNMASFPPFSMFFIKWTSIYFLISSNYLLILPILTILISSFFMFYIYMNMIFMFMFISTINYKFFYLNDKKYNFFLINMFSFSIFFLFLFSSILLILT